MNKLQSSARKNAVEVLTEDLLWAKGLLGGETPKMLLDSVVRLQWYVLRTTQWERASPIETFTLPS